jgi:hypothetical protein
MALARNLKLGAPMLIDIALSAPGANVGRGGGSSPTSAGDSARLPEPEYPSNRWIVDLGRERVGRV